MTTAGDSRTDLVRTHIEAALMQINDDEERRVAELCALENKGHRLVGGGQTGGGGDMPQTWNITDYWTGEVLAEGEGLDECDAAFDRLDPDGMFVNVDRVTMEFEYGPTPVTPGIPETLGATLYDWVESADDEEIAEFIGWSVEKVKGCR